MMKNCLNCASRRISNSRLPCKECDGTEKWTPDENAIKDLRIEELEKNLQNAVDRIVEYQAIIVGVIHKSSRFYKNCKAQRKRGAKICQECPLRAQIEQWEKSQEAE